MLEKRPIKDYENYSKILNSYRNIFKKKSEQIDNLFEEIKTMKKLKV